MAEALARAKTRGPPGSESGWVSDFEEEGLSARFGAGWRESTDTGAGGKSTVVLSVRRRGAHGSKGALSIRGRVDAPELPYAWAGAMFMPGEKAHAPANLSMKKAVSFWTRGDARTYRLLLFTKRGGPRPYGTTFEVTGEWRAHRVPLERLGGAADDVTAILFAGGPWQGEFELDIDDVRFEGAE
jgi:hypothetical protein